MELNEVKLRLVTGKIEANYLFGKNMFIMTATENAMVIARIKIVSIFIRLIYEIFQRYQILIEINYNFLGLHFPYINFYLKREITDFVEAIINHLSSLKSDGNKCQWSNKFTLKLYLIFCHSSNNQKQFVSIAGANNVLL